jgi:hypothetical protein
MDSFDCSLESLELCIQALKNDIAVKKLHLFHLDELFAFRIRFQLDHHSTFIIHPKLFDDLACERLFIEARNKFPLLPLSSDASSALTLALSEYLRRIEAREKSIDVDPSHVVPLHGILLSYPIVFVCPSSSSTNLALQPLQLVRAWIRMEEHRSGSVETPLPLKMAKTLLSSFSFPEACRSVCDARVALWKLQTSALVRNVQSLVGTSLQIEFEDCLVCLDAVAL